ncbi:MAG: hypothetical protein Ct9H300mP25_03860 [Acidobacteriota bacterium]|nr:MAG: hypothetical protein Ct9H300mP25_03860 [Acidobacteriota bacterium]
MSRFKCSCSRRDFCGKARMESELGRPTFTCRRTSAALAAQAFTGTSMETNPERILLLLNFLGVMRSQYGGSIWERRILSGPTEPRNF